MCKILRPSENPVAFFLSKKLKYVFTTMARWGNRDKQFLDEESTIKKYS